MRRKHEKDTGVHGSPQNRGYVHQTVASCEIYFHKWLQYAQLGCDAFFFLFSWTPSLGVILSSLLTKIEVLVNRQVTIILILESRLNLFYLILL